jgi:hypothetical protein
MMSVAPLAISIELHDLGPSTVNVKLAPTMISSPAAGMAPPGQGALGTVELQLPDPVVVTVAAEEKKQTACDKSRSRDLSTFIETIQSHLEKY